MNPNVSTANARRTLAAAAAAIACASSAGTSGADAQEVNFYTTREPGLIRPLLDTFTAKTKIKVNTVFVKDGLAERVAAEGPRSPADVLMTVDFGNLVDLVDKGVTQPVKSAALEAAIPAQLRDPAGHWFAMSMRARIVYAAKGRVKPDGLTYESLADPQWKGKVCIRSGQHPYNTALVANLIARSGEPAAEAWLTGVKANLARKASGGDREVARDILAQICDIGVGNSYYVGLMRSGKGGPEQQKWGDAIDTVLPRFAGGGTHVNASGAAIARNSPNRANALALLEYLVTDAAQADYAKLDFEYPVKAGAPIDPIIDKIGKLEPDKTSLLDVARNRRKASLLVDKVGFDN